LDYFRIAEHPSGNIPGRQPSLILDKSYQATRSHPINAVALTNAALRAFPTKNAGTQNTRKRANRRHFLARLFVPQGSLKLYPDGRHL